MAEALQNSSTMEPDQRKRRGQELFLGLEKRGRIRVVEFKGPKGAPTLVLLHGLGATGRLNWFAAFPELAQRYHVVAVDHRGHGQGIRTRWFRLKDCADDVIAVADQLGIDRFMAVGYSMGGPIAKLCWNRHPTRVRGLVLCATSRYFTPLQFPILTRAIFLVPWSALDWRPSWCSGRSSRTWSRPCRLKRARTSFAVRCREATLQRSPRQRERCYASRHAIGCRTSRCRLRW